MTATVLTAPARDHTHADSNRLRNSIEQCADGYCKAAAGLLLFGGLVVPGALAVLGPVAGKNPVSGGIYSCAAKEADRGRVESAAVVGVIHEIERERRDKNAAPERHDGSRQTLGQSEKVAGESANYQGRAGHRSPESGLRPEGHTTACATLMPSYGCHRCRFGCRCEPRRRVDQSDHEEISVGVLTLEGSTSVRSPVPVFRRTLDRTQTVFRADPCDRDSRERFGCVARVCPVQPFK